MRKAALRSVCSGCGPATVVDEGARLRYEISSADPATYTEPLTLTKHYLWVPGLEIRPYECTEE